MSLRRLENLPFSETAPWLPRADGVAESVVSGRTGIAWYRSLCVRGEGRPGSTETAVVPLPVPRCVRHQVLATPYALRHEIASLHQLEGSKSIELGKRGLSDKLLHRLLVTVLATHVVALMLYGRLDFSASAP